MASNQSTVDYLLDQMGGPDRVSARKMFGEYGIYCEGRMVALVCDDQLFVKPTSAGRALVGEVVEAPPYKGAKPCFLIPADRWDDAEWLSSLISASARELPIPARRKRTLPKR